MPKKGFFWHKIFFKKYMNFFAWLIAAKNVIFSNKIIVNGLKNILKFFLGQFHRKMPKKGFFWHKIFFKKYMNFFAWLIAAKNVIFSNKIIVNGLKNILKFFLGQFHRKMPKKGFFWHKIFFKKYMNFFAWLIAAKNVIFSNKIIVNGLKNILKFFLGQFHRKMPKKGFFWHKIFFKKYMNFFAWLIAAKNVIFSNKIIVNGLKNILKFFLGQFHRKMPKKGFFWHKIFFKKYMNFFAWLIAAKNVIFSNKIIVNGLKNILKFFLGQFHRKMPKKGFFWHKIFFKKYMNFFAWLIAAKNVIFSNKIIVNGLKKYFKIFSWPISQKNA
jgi:3-phenylpropionate/cinnamic acid dioxygenase small subunit